MSLVEAAKQKVVGSFALGAAEDPTKVAIILIFKQELNVHKPLLQSSRYDRQQ